MQILTHCKSCKICCYFSFELNLDRKQHFLKSIMTSQLTFTFSYSTQLSKKNTFRRLYLELLWYLWTNNYLMRSFSTLHYLSQASSERYQTSRVEFFPKIVNDFQSLAIFVRSSIVGVWQGCECILLRFSKEVFPNNCIS